MSSLMNHPLNCSRLFFVHLIQPRLDGFIWRDKVNRLLLLLNAFIIISRGRVKADFDQIVQFNIQLFGANWSGACWPTVRFGYVGWLLIVPYVVIEKVKHEQNARYF